MTTWLGEETTPSEPRSGYADVVRRWLWTFGPGTEADLVWWLGATKAAVRAALSDVDAIQVELENGSTGWVLPHDTADLEVPAPKDPWVARLPVLDPTTMGWRSASSTSIRAHAVSLRPCRQRRHDDLDQRADRRVLGSGRSGARAAHPDGKRSRRVSSACSTQRRRLDEFLGGEHITNVFASPQMKHQRLS